jgi:hypothetical protein
MIDNPNFHRNRALAKYASTEWKNSQIGINDLNIEISQASSDAMPNTIFDQYHKLVYPKVTGIKHLVFGNSTVNLEKIESKLIFPGLIGSQVLMLAPRFFQDQLGPELAAELTNYGVQVSTLLGAYLIPPFLIDIPNRFKTSAARRMGLSVGQSDPSEDLYFVADELNKRADAAEIDFDEAKSLSADAVRSYHQKIYGFASAPAKVFFDEGKPNTTVPLHYNTILHQITAYRDDFPELLAHEQAHAQGIRTERDAEVFGMVSQIESDNQSVQYLGYLRWLSSYLLQANFSDDEGNQIAKSQIMQELQLNPRTTSDIEKRLASIKIITGVETNPAEGETVSVDKSQKNKSALEGFMSDLKMKLLGQGSTTEAYVISPLEIMHSYRLQVEKNNPGLRKKVS